MAEALSFSPSHHQQVNVRDFSVTLQYPASSRFPPPAAFFIKCPSWGVVSGYHPLFPAVDLGSRKAAGIRNPDPHSSDQLSGLVTQQRFQALCCACCPPRIWSRWRHRPNPSLTILRDNLNRKKTSSAHWSLLLPVVSCLKPVLRTYGMFQVFSSIGIKVFLF